MTVTPKTRTLNSVGLGRQDAWQAKWREMLNKQKRQREVRESFRNMKEGQLDMKKIFPPIDKKSMPSERDYRLLRERLKKSAYKQKEALHELYELLEEEKKDPEIRECFLTCLSELLSKHSLDTFHWNLKEITVDRVFDIVQDIVNTFLPWTHAIKSEFPNGEIPESFWNLKVFWSYLSQWRRSTRLIQIRQLLDKLEEIDGEVERLVEPFGVRCAPNNPLYEFRLADEICKEHPWLESVSKLAPWLEYANPLVRFVLENESYTHNEEQTQTLYTQDRVSMSEDRSAEQIYSAADYQNRPVQRETYPEEVYNRPGDNEQGGMCVPVLAEDYYYSTTSPVIGSTLARPKGPLLKATIWPQCNSSTANEETSKYYRSYDITELIKNPPLPPMLDVNDSSPNWPGPISYMHPYAPQAPCSEDSMMQYFQPYASQLHPLHCPGSVIPYHLSQLGMSTDQCEYVPKVMQGESSSCTETANKVTVNSGIRGMLDQVHSRFVSKESAEGDKKRTFC